MSYSLGIALERLGKIDPAFEQVCERMQTEWEGERPPVTLVFSNYATDFTDRVKRGAVPNLQSILDTLEDLMLNGHQEVKDAVATGFWETVLSKSSKGDFDFHLLAARIGLTTKEFCLAWDRFTGIQTPGLNSPNQRN